MADVVLGLGTSHTPQLSSTAALWSDHALRDRANTRLLGDDGEFYSFEELLTMKKIPESELTAAVWAQKYDRAQYCIQVIAKRLEQAKPDVVIIVGDDQRELFDGSCSPALAFCTADALWDSPPPLGEYRTRVETFPGLAAAEWAVHGPEPARYPVAQELSTHLVETLIGDGFDIAVLASQRPPQRLGHAFTFCRYRLGLPSSTAIVPVMLNTIYPPNVLLPGRCFELGRCLRKGISDFSGSHRIAIVASGGLSHFVVLEEWDRNVLELIRARDGQALSDIPPKYFRSGTSETLNWITAAGALEDSEMTLIDYIPGYRSVAGTGTGLAFGVWEMN
jgi:3-O-methylgallate 3,4-dioxygenase